MFSLSLTLSLVGAALHGRQSRPSARPLRLGATAATLKIGLRCKPRPLLPDAPPRGSGICIFHVAFVCYFFYFILFFLKNESSTCPILRYFGFGYIIIWVGRGEGHTHMCRTRRYSIKIEGLYDIFFILLIKFYYIWDERCVVYYSYSSSIMKMQTSLASALILYPSVFEHRACLNERRAQNPHLRLCCRVLLV